MNRIIFISILILLVSTNTNAQSKVDLLRAIWEDSSKPERDRLLGLTLMSQKYLNDNIDKDSALFYADIAYKRAIELGFDSIACFSQTIIGNVYLDRSDYNNSIKSYNEAFSLAKKNDFIVLESVALLSIGSDYRRRGNYDEAMESFNQSIESLYKVNKPDSLSSKDYLAISGYLANAYNNKGIINIIRNNHEQAEKDLNQSIEHFQKSDKPFDSAGPMTNIGIMKRREGDYASAIRQYMQALQIIEQKGDELVMSSIQMNIANLYSQQENDEKFLEFANKSLEIRKRIGNKRGEMICLFALGNYHNQKLNYTVAEPLLLESLTLANQLDHKLYIADISLSLTGIYIAQKHFEKAKELIDTAYNISNGNSNTNGIAKALTLYGELYFGKGELSSAKRYYLQALESVGHSEFIQNKVIYEALYKVSKQEKNSIEALKYYELFIKSRDSILSKKNRSEIIRQEFKYEYDKKILADSLAFAAQQQIQETKLEKTQSQRQSLFLILIVVVGFTILLIARNRIINNQKETIANQNSELQDLNENLEEKVAERTKELKESDERYTYALEASSDGIWDYDVKSDTIKFSPAIYTMLGFEPYEFPESREAIYKLLHKEDIRISKRKEHDLFIIKNHQEFLADEYRLIGKDGAPVWVQVKGKIVERDTENNPARIVGTHTNITESKLRNQETLATILRTEDAERSRISKDIHDGLQQTLTISFLNFNGLKKHIKDLKDDLKEKYNLGFQYLQKSIHESRDVAHTLMPKSIMDYGVLSACQRLVDDMNKSNEQTEFTFHHNLKSERLPNHQIEITLYRILQESLNNIVKYAKATNVDISLKDYDDMYMLTIEDNGIGFDTKVLEKEDKGLGFRSMKNRLDAINGYLEIDSEKGEGTTVLVQIDKAA